MRYLLPAAVLFFTSCSHTYYIVRHAEKEGQGMGAGSMMTNDPPLSAAGKERAATLNELLKNKKIGYVYSTKYIRSTATAQPIANRFGLKVQLYGPAPDSAFIANLKKLKKNVLVVGHSNTIDDIANMLCNEKKVPGDLKESEYDNLFIVKKKGKHYIFSWKHYGVATP